MRRKRTKGSYISVDSLIAKAVKRLNLQPHIDLYNIQKNYKNMFGKDVANYSSPDRLIKGTLSIIVSNSPWLMQLSFIKNDIKERINNDLKRNVVRNVTFKVGKLSKFKVNKKHKDYVSLRNIKVGEREQKLIDESVRDIEDGALRKSIIAAETAYYKRKTKKVDDE